MTVAACGLLNGRCPGGIAGMRRRFVACISTTRRVKESQRGTAEKTERKSPDYHRRRGGMPQGVVRPGKRRDIAETVERGSDQALPVLTTGGPMSRFTAGTVLRYL